jgi:RNA polymerase sigma-70 factor (ECF subfamily)
MAASSDSPPSGPRQVIRGRVCEEVARRYGRQLLVAARQLTRDADSACDLLQDAFERALRSERDMSPETLAGWIFTVMRNLFVDGCRRERCLSRGLRALHTSPAETITEPDETLPQSLGITSEDLTLALSQLEAPFRDVFELSARSLSLAEIAAVLGIRTATAGTRLFRARRKLRVLLARPQFGNDRDRSCA